MSIDNIQLPTFLYQKIYKNNLVEITSSKKDKTSKEKSKIDFLGGNEKKIIFLAKDDQSKFLSDDKMKFLNGLLVACGLNMNDIAFVNVSQNGSISYKEINDQLQPGKILIFGVSGSLLDMPFEIPFFQIQNFNNKQYMLAPSLDELQGNVELKKQLWICFQKIFNIQKQK